MSHPQPQFKVVPLEPVTETPPDKKDPQYLPTWIAFGIGFIVILLIGGVSGYWWLSHQQTISTESPKITDRETFSIPTVVPLLTWDDPAGFTFSYPEDLIIDKHDEDQENYAHVELTHSLHPGRIIVWVKDLPLSAKQIAVTNLDEWLTSDSVLSSGNAIDTTIGDKNAKKVLLKGSPEKAITGVVFDGVLWLIEGEFDDKEYWTSIYKSVSDSFLFKPVTDDTITYANDQDTAIAVDEEEVIE